MTFRCVDAPDFALTHKFPFPDDRVSYDQGYEDGFNAGCDDDPEQDVRDDDASARADDYSDNDDPERDDHGDNVSERANDYSDGPDMNENGDSDYHSDY